MNQKVSMLSLFKTIKFYFASENSWCDGYITKKFARGAFNGMVPLAAGGRRNSDYERILPREGFLRVDNFPSAKALAERLLELGKDDAAYNRLHAWRQTYSAGLLGSSNFMPYCELCKQLYLPEGQQKPR